ncbi:hypothetical protein ACSSS7_000033 [Eimeria intestinalis]
MKVLLAPLSLSSFLLFLASASELPSNVSSPPGAELEPHQVANVAAAGAAKAPTAGPPLSPAGSGLKKALIPAAVFALVALSAAILLLRQKKAAEEEKVSHRQHCTRDHSTPRASGLLPTL